MKIGIFGGSFDPPHAGHLEIAEAVLEKKLAGHIYFMPANIQPFKQDKKTLAPKDRFALTELLAEGNERISALDYEIKKTGISYTYDSLRALQKKFDAPVSFIQGEDTFRMIEQWKDARKLLREFEFIVAKRNPHVGATFGRPQWTTIKPPEGATDGRPLPEFARALERKYGAKITLLENDYIDLSSTEIRAALRRIFAAANNLGEAYKETENFLLKKRYQHTLAVIDMAKELAEKYGADAKAAELAALLHDAAKDVSTNLLHGPLAAAYAGLYLPNDIENRADIINAVRYHTTGRSGMSLLEKTVFLADKIEPNRDFVGIDELRQAAGISLEEGVREYLAQLADYMDMKGIVPFTGSSPEALTLAPAPLPARKRNLKNYALDALRELLQNEFGEKPYRANQIYEWLYKGIFDYAEMSNLPEDLILKLRRKTLLASLKLRKTQVSARDGTKKFLFETIDNEFIESVLMHYDYGDALCISTQAGCKRACAFCASGGDGLVRNLSPAEIIDQLLLAERENGGRISHVVFMGIGEPLDNYDNLMTTIENLTNPKGMAMGRKHITVSTCGVLPMMEKFLQELPMANLAISLHAPTNGLRNKLMPINKKYPIEELIAFAKKYSAGNRRITFEYALISSVNDSEADAKRLTSLLKKNGGIDCHVNLIKLNAGGRGDFAGSSEEVAVKFKETLEAGGVVVTIRRSLGADIAAACGQLHPAAETSAENGPTAGRPLR